VALNTTNQIKCNQILQIKGTTLFLFPVLPEHFVVFDRFPLQTVTVCVEVLVRSSFNTFYFLYYLNILWFLIDFLYKL
jgi:hypothetical protein